MALQAVYASGIRAVAVVLKHAALYPAHEQAVGELARQMGFEQVPRVEGAWG
jgi:5-oxoprolinase (ATP-hydrolysing)